MPDVTPSGPYSLARNNLRYLIANMGYFQTWTGTHTEAEALARVLPGGLRLDIGDGPERPFVILQTAEGTSSVDEVGVSTLLPRGAIDIILEGEVDSQYYSDPLNATMQAENEYGDFIGALRDNNGYAGSARRMVLRRVTAGDLPAFIPPEGQAPGTYLYSVWQARIRVEWGGEG